MTANNTWINGEQVDCIDAGDRGLQYGDGVFETLRVHQQGIPLWSYHWQRLQSSCARLAINLPDKTTLEAYLHPALQGQQEAVVKLLVTRGIGERGYRIDPSARASIIVMRFPASDYSSVRPWQGVTTRLCNTRLSRQPLLAGIKHLNRLEQVLARSEWTDPGIMEGLMCNQQGELIEGTMSNLFIVRQGKLQTPLLNECGICGVMREVILSMAEQLTISYEETVLHPAELAEADEVFLTNSVIGIWPVVQCEQFSYVPGPVTKQLQHELHQRYAYNQS